MNFMSFSNSAVFQILMPKKCGKYATCTFNSRTQSYIWSFHEIKVKMGMISCIYIFEDFVAKTSIQTFLNIPRRFDSYCQQNSDTTYVVPLSIPFPIMELADISEHNLHSIR